MVGGVVAKVFILKNDWTGTAGQGSSDVFEGYARSAFKAAGFTQTVVTDARTYHDASGSPHCGTNAIRSVPGAKWWEA